MLSKVLLLVSLLAAQAVAVAVPPPSNHGKGAIPPPINNDDSSWNFTSSLLSNSSLCGPSTVTTIVETFTPVPTPSTIILNTPVPTPSTIFLNTPSPFPNVPSGIAVLDSVGRRQLSPLLPTSTSSLKETVYPATLSPGPFPTLAARGPSPSHQVNVDDIVAATTGTDGVETVLVIHPTTVTVTETDACSSAPIPTSSPYGF